MWLNLPSLYRHETQTQTLSIGDTPQPQTYAQTDPAGKRCSTSFDAQFETKRCVLHLLGHFTLGSCCFSAPDATQTEQGNREIMHGPLTHVMPTPTSKRAHKLMIFCTVSMALANHHTLPNVAVDATFTETSLQIALMCEPTRDVNRASSSVTLT